MQEEVILQKMQSGDPAGLEALMERYIPYVSKVVWNILRNAIPTEDGEEVVSDVFLTAWRQAKDLRPGAVKAWLAAVARNRAKSRLRKAGRELPLKEDVLEIPGPDDPPNDLEQAEERRLVRQAVDALPGQDREIFLRYYYYAQTVQEIAEQMGMNGSTVKTRLHRGRTKLKQTLTGEGYLDEA